MPGLLEKLQGEIFRAESENNIPPLRHINGMQRWPGTFHTNVWVFNTHGFFKSIPSAPPPELTLFSFEHSFSLVTEEIWSALSHINISPSSDTSCRQHLFFQTEAYGITLHCLGEFVSRSLVDEYAAKRISCQAWALKSETLVYLFPWIQVLSWLF